MLKNIIKSLVYTDELAVFDSIQEKCMKSRKWTPEDKKTLYDLKTNTDLTFVSIGKKMDRSARSVSNMFRNTNWKAFFRKHTSKKTSALTKQVATEAYTDTLVKALIQFARHDLRRLRETTKQQFMSNTILRSTTLPITYTELKRRAIYELQQIGFSYPSSKVFGKGTYIIVGDTHGKHTRSGMISLLKTLSKHVNAKKIIHVGHFIDDDDDHNFNWDKINNLCIVSKVEELKFISKLKLNHDIVRHDVILGEKLTVRNQDLITDFVQTPLSQSITPEYFPTSTICNLHRHEFDTRCCEQGESSYVGSPGCICENHIVYTIKQQDFTDGRTVKQTFPTGYKKYRRMEHMYETWQQGCIIVEVDSEGKAHPHMCRIYETSKGYTTSYFDKIITENEILDPDDKTLLVSDPHIDMHDEGVLDIAEQIANRYKPDTVGNLGDTAENKSVNHHEFKKMGCTRSDKNTLVEAAACNYIITRMRTWADDMIILTGNHERFLEDYTDKNPQFIDILNFEFLNSLTDLDVEIIELKMSKKHQNARLVHGELLMYGQKGGNKLDKLFRTFGRNTCMGHCHYPSCRFDCYSVGLLGKLDLEYNEVDASKWVHSVATCNSFEDVAFISNILIIDDDTRVANHSFKPRHNQKWKIPPFKAKIQFDFAAA